MSIERSTRRIAARRLTATARSLLDASSLCAIATVSSGGRAHINTAYFAWNPKFELVWLSEPRAAHSRNVHMNDSVAVAVSDSSQRWGGLDRGIQLFGVARRAEGSEAEDAEAVYAARFPGYRELELTAYAPYVFRPRRVKLFDERELGAGTFVTARVAVRGLAWERTEIYRPN